MISVRTELVYNPVQKKTFFGIIYIFLKSPIGEVKFWGL